MAPRFHAAALAAAFLPVAIPIAADLVAIEELNMDILMPAQAVFSTEQMQIPPQAQILDPASFAAMPSESVLPPDKSHGRTIFIPPGSTLESLKERPFHVYDLDFLNLIGAEPELSLLAEHETNPLFHEAVVWHRPTDAVFFAQNAGAKAARTGLDTSAVVQRITMADALSVAQDEHGGSVHIEVVGSTPPILNPNGGTNYKGDILFVGEGMGTVPPALYAMNPIAPYNTTVLLNNFYGRQFNSLNDVAVHPNGDIYFTDVTYGFWQDFRPPPALPNQVYRLNPRTRAVTAVTDAVPVNNGITFSPDGRWAYVTSTAASKAYKGFDSTLPASIYRFEVTPSGAFQNRILFAYVDTGVPDGIHCDADGNVYSACGDGVYVWNTEGTLLGKIFVGGPVGNFQFAGDGRIVICAETRLYLARVAAKGAPIH